MKQNSKQLKITMNGKRMAGGMLLEVVLAIAVFAFGMLALVQLQGNLTRSSADATTRTVATNIAEEIIENIRGFKQVDPVVDPNEWGYLELVGNALNTTVTRGGMDYAVSAEISDFWWDKVQEKFVKNDAIDPPTVPDDVGGLAYASFKLLKIDVAWNTSQDFYLDDDNTAVLGPGNITIYEIIPNSPPSLGAKIAANPNAAGNGPFAQHTPGDKPDIVALDLGGTVAKESTTPVPDIISSGRLTEVSFDVVTYNTVNNAFIRREEFVTVGCECTLHTDGNGGGLRPTVWNGVDYTAAEFIADKNYGESSNNQQSVFCDLCCRDHHDGGTGTTDTAETRKQVYNPWSGANGSQDHKHYRREGNGQLVEASNGQNYAEACRLIRKDGFFRVAQDFNQEGFFGIPHDYLDNDHEIGEYSDYVNDAVDDFYVKNPTTMKQPGDDPLIEFTNPATGLKDRKLPAMVPETATNLPILVPPYSVDQQLRSRGVYNDYLSDETKAKITDCQNDISRCILPHFDPLVGLLAYYPYFDIQLTNLATWREVVPDKPVHVTNQKIESIKPYSKGLAKKMNEEGDSSTIKIEFLDGNVGIAAVDPIAPPTAAAAAAVPTVSGPRDLFIQTDGSPSDYPGIEITGEFLAGSNSIKTRNIEILFNEIKCGRTATGYMCVIPTDDQGNVLASYPTLSVSDISGNNQTYYACSAILGSGIVGPDGWTTFSLKTYTVDDGPADIVIQETGCG